MNDDKRERIQQIIDELNQLRDEEEKDLADTPDNIEHGQRNEIVDAFDNSIFCLRLAITALKWLL